MPRAKKQYNTRKRTGRPWGIYALIAVVVAVVVSIVAISRSKGSSNSPQVISGPITHSCAELKPNQVFSVYPSNGIIQNINKWPGRQVDAPTDRLNRIHQLLAESGAPASEHVGLWLLANEMNTEFATTRTIEGGAGMGVGLKNDKPTLVIGTAILDEGDLVKLALYYAHETIHYQAFLNDQPGDPDNDHLCEEMMAYALETLIYSEFRQEGYFLQQDEEMLILLRDKLHWQWQSIEWANLVRSRLN